MTTTSTPRHAAPTSDLSRFTFAPRPSAATCAIIGKHAAPLPHDMHCAYPHRDAMVPWCDVCGLDEAGRPMVPLAEVMLAEQVPGRHRPARTGPAHMRRTDTTEMPVVHRVETAEMPALRMFAELEADDEIGEADVDTDSCVFCGADPSRSCAASCPWGGAA